MRFSTLFDLFRPSTFRDVSGFLDENLKQRIVVLDQVIDDQTGYDVIKRLLFLDMESATKPIQLIINSPGGLVSAGLAIVDAMAKIRAPVETHCLGTAHSMAAVILARGRSGSRTATANATITFTLPRAPADADKQGQKEAVRLGEVLISEVATATRRTAAEIRVLFEQATDLSASDAAATGIIDAIIPPRL